MALGALCTAVSVISAFTHKQLQPLHPPAVVQNLRLPVITMTARWFNPHDHQSIHSLLSVCTIPSCQVHTNPLGLP